MMYVILRWNHFKLVLLIITTATVTVNYSAIYREVFGYMQQFSLYTIYFMCFDRGRIN